MARFLQPVLMLSMFILFGCGRESEPAGNVLATERQADSATAVPLVQRPARKKGASLVLGEQSFALDVVLCIGTSMASAVASDSQKRPDYPVITIKTYDPAMTGGESIDTVAVYFERDGYGEHWTLQEGVVARDGKVFTAIGKLGGSRLLPQIDGTRKSVPLEGRNILPVEVRIEC